MAGKAFAASVKSWAAEAKVRRAAVVKTAAQAVADDATPPVADGGRMRVDTRFLLNSLVADIGQMPRGPSVRGRDKMGDASAVALVIAKMKMGEVLYMGFSASYARPREMHDGFVAAAAQKWPQFVNNAITEAMRRIK